MSDGKDQIEPERSVDPIEQVSVGIAGSIVGAVAVGPGAHAEGTVNLTVIMQGPRAIAFDATDREEAINRLLEPYIEQIRRNLDQIKPISRELRLATGDRVKLGEGPAHGFDINDGDVIFISGWSGRGKSTLLRILARQTLNQSPIARIPIFVRAENVEKTVIQCISQSLVVSGIVREIDLSLWLDRQPTLLLIDDLHHASEKIGRMIFDFIALSKPAKMAIAIATLPTIPPPGLLRMRHIELNRYSLKERDAVIRGYLTQKPDVDAYANEGAVALDLATSIIDRIPDGIDELLREPVVLNQFLFFVRRYPSATTLPNNVPELLDMSLKQLLAPRHQNPALRLREISDFCMELAKGPRKIRGSMLRSVAQKVGLSENPMLLAQDMEAAGIAVLNEDAYEFSHELWKRHFESKAIRDSGAWDTPDNVREWIGKSEVAELMALLPFLAGSVRDPEAQDAMLDALLQKNVELYFRALPLRGSVRGSIDRNEWAMLCLRALRSGYVDLVERHFAPFKDHIDPWCYPTDADPHVIIIGRVGRRNLEYAFLLADEHEDDIVLMLKESHEGTRNEEIEDQIPVIELEPNTVHDHLPVFGVTFESETGRWRFLDLACSARRPGSTRLIAAELVLANIESALKEKLIRAPWTMRGKFAITLMEASYDGGLDNWQHRTVQEIVGLANIDCEAVSRNEPTISFVTDIETLTTIVEIGQWLIRHDLGNLVLNDLTLPGPELIDNELRYSPERQLTRVAALYRAVAQTYRFMCAGLSEEIKGHIFFAQWPCRAIVELEREGDTPGWQMYWEPCESWDVPPIVRVARDRSRLFSAFGELYAQECERCYRLERPFLDLQCQGTAGSWGMWDDAVTDETCALLLDDIKQLRDWLKNGT